MHRALLIAEILLEIFAHVKSLPLDPWYAIDEKPTSRKCLAALARTCKKFYEPAMDFLWADLNEYDGIAPLLGCVTRYIQSYIVAKERRRSTPRLVDTPSRFPSMRPINFCVTLPVCAHCV
ncbi:hypothetical protein EV702DRAFT_1099123 [Suillus placidus]|uniref:F-box domain-containing protein n=1 Tax=Suillus placidus TaxID=48579 RepID=A0A9P6ZWA1_9AGAM|nr:hypothetical protein EV702DRAFT_1099123 [Suillus placidus]